jgi:hypothetical protein
MAKYKTLAIALPLVFGLTALVVPKRSGQEQTTPAQSLPSKTQKKSLIQTISLSWHFQP